MKKWMKVYLTINAITGLYALGRIGIAYLNARNPKKLEQEVTDAFNEIIDSVTKDLQLAQRPTLLFTNAEPETMMATRRTIHTQGLFAQTIISCDPSYVIEVNTDNIRKLLRTFDNLFFRKSIHNAALKFFIAHECRHIWQAQGDFYIGREVNLLSGVQELLHGYGNAPEESDANEYALTVAANDKELSLFKYLKAEQDNHGKIVGGSAELQAAAKDVRKAWKPLFGFLF